MLSRSTATVWRKSVISLGEIQERMQWSVHSGEKRAAVPSAGRTICIRSNQGNADLSFQVDLRPDCRMRGGSHKRLIVHPGGNHRWSHRQKPELSTWWKLKFDGEDRKK